MESLKRKIPKTMRSPGTTTGGVLTADDTPPADSPSDPGAARIVAPTPPAVRRQGDSGPAQPTRQDDQPPADRSRFFKPEGSEEPAGDQATHGSGKRNAEVAGSDEHALSGGRDGPMGRG